MRRADREAKKPEEIAAILRKCVILRVAFNASPAPYVLPVNFGFERNDEKFTLYFHTAKEGRKIELLNSNGNVGFEADRVVETVVEKTPCRSTTYFESVIGSGKATLLSSRAEKKAGMDAVMRLAGYVGELEYPDAALDGIAIVKIDVEEIVGKRHLPE